MNYSFNNILGSTYTGGNIVYEKDVIYFPVGNRIRQVILNYKVIKL